MVPTKSWWQKTVSPSRHWSRATLFQVQRLKCLSYDYLPLAYFQKRPTKSHWFGVDSKIFPESSTFMPAFLTKLLLFSFSAVSDSLDPTDHRTSGFPVLHHLPKFVQTHVHWVSDAIQPSHPLLSPSPPALNLPHTDYAYREIILMLASQ